jgi:hypothetical protein
LPGTQAPLPGPEAAFIGLTGHAVCVPWVAAILLVLLLFLVRKSFGAVEPTLAVTMRRYVSRTPVRLSFVNGTGGRVMHHAAGL